MSLIRRILSRVRNPTDKGRRFGRMLLQWHVTERCNLRCAHCYQDGSPSQELEYQDLLRIVLQFHDLIKIRGKTIDGRVRGHITLTGGEPFVRRDFEEVLRHIAGERSWTSFAILTNGTLINDERARRLANLQVSYVQVSIDGTQAAHDQIRGKGNFQLTVEAVKHLVRAGIRTVISFTAHQGNYREFTAVAELGCRLQASRVWADRLVPCGQGADLAILSPEQTFEFFGIMRRARDSARRWRFCHTEVSMHRALQFLKGGCRPYHCTAGDTLLTVMPNGDLYPCRRMPVRVGNVMEKPLEQLYQDEFLRSLRNPHQVSQGCEQCVWRKLCRGGLRCLSYARTGSPFIADPGCWLASAKTG